MARIRKGDMVEILSGNDRGKRGRVLRMLPDKDRLVVQGVNLRWKHMRKSQQSPQGGRMRKEMPIHISNVMLFLEGEETRTRVGFTIHEGKKVRVARRTGALLDGAGSEQARKRRSRKKKKPAAAGETSGGAEES